MTSSTVSFCENVFSDMVDQCKIESPIEQEFYRVISKYLTPKTELQNQYAIKAGKYNFRVDFVVLIGDRKIGFECDGKAFHEHEKDEWRDGVILNGGHLESIVRLRGTDINFRMLDSLFVISQWYPDLFSARGVDNIEHLSTLTAKGTPIGMDEAYFSYRPAEVVENEELDSDEVVDDPLSHGFGQLHVTRQRKIMAGAGREIPR